MKRRLRLVGHLAVFCGVLLIGDVGRAQTALNVDEMRTVAAKSLKVGQPAQALALADALLQRDANDLTALLVRARALRDLGQMDAALRSVKSAWRLADNPGDKFASSLITAQVLSSDGKRTRAQMWLRRAAHHAPNDALKARALNDFAYVRQNNPWKTQLSFTLAPNSNINNGSARDRSQLNYKLSEALFGEPVEFALTGSARALPGLEYGAGLRTRYRFKQTETTAQDLKLSLSYRSFVLANEARSTAPGTSGTDFAFGVASIGYGYRQINLDRKGEFAFDTDIGQAWYGGARYFSYARASVAQTWKRNQRQKLRFAFGAEQQNGQRTADVSTFTISASLNQRLGSGNVAFFKLAAETTNSDTAGWEYNEIELRTGYVLAKSVMGASVQFGFGAAYRDYDFSPHSADGRQDAKIFADVTATFKQIDYYGFNPSVTLSAAHTDSNIGLFDLNRVGLSIGIRSAF